MSGYAIKPGDTLSGIAKRNGTSVQALLQQNPQIADPNMIQAGATLQMPAGAAVPPPAGAQAAAAQGQQAAADCEDAPADDKVVKGCPLNKGAKNPVLQDLAEPSEDELEILANPEADNTPLGQKIKSATGGLSISEVQKLYREAVKRRHPDKHLSVETLDSLFNDATAAKRLLEADATLETTLRDILNQNVPKTLDEMNSINEGISDPNQRWELLDPSQSSFHDPDNKLKFVSADGHREAIYNKADGSLDDDTIYKGTFNFFGPSQYHGHMVADVAPWKKSSDGKEWAEKHSDQWIDNGGLKFMNAYAGTADTARSASDGVKRGGAWVGNKAVDAYGGMKKTGAKIYDSLPDLDALWD